MAKQFSDMPRIKGTGLAALLACLAATTACSGEAATEGAETQAAPEEASAFLPAEFAPPVLVEGDGFKLVPLGPELMEIDYQAYMSSIEHLQQTFTRTQAWPREDLTLEDAVADMANEQTRFAERSSFAYGVLTPDGSREMGSVYIRPSPVAGYDAAVSFWTTKADYDAGFDAQLYDWVQQWITQDWPFETVAYPGRAIDWQSWDAMIAEQEG